MARLDSMAVIDAALLGDQTGTPATVPVPAPAPLDPANATTTPGVEDATGEDVEDVPMSKEEKVIYEQQKKLLGEQKAAELRQQQLEEQRKAEALRLADKATDQARKMTEAASVKIGAVPTPGSIAFPLILLVLFGFILIKFNGFTRIQWLWLTLTNNAYVLDAAQDMGTPSGGLGTGGGPPNPAQESLIGEIVLPPIVTTYSKSGIGEAY